MSEQVEWLSSELLPFGDFELPEGVSLVEALVAYCAAVGVERCVMLESGSEVLRGQRFLDGMNMAIVENAFNTCLLLQRLAVESPDEAEDAAGAVLAAAEDGSSFGEWLHQWGAELGVDMEAVRVRAEAVCAELASELGREVGETFTWDGSPESYEAICKALPGRVHGGRGVPLLYLKHPDTYSARIGEGWRIRIEGDSFAVLPPAQETDQEVGR